MFNSLETALLSADAADDKKAYDIQLLDLRGLTNIADYFVICSCANSSQVSAVFDWIEQSLARVGVRASHIEGRVDATWVLMDYGDVVIHIFSEETRLYYSLEKLWADAPRVPVSVRSKVLQTLSS